MRAKFVYENLIQALDEAEKIDPEKLQVQQKLSIFVTGTMV